MNPFPEGNAVVYCAGAFGTPNGKTAHGLIRATLRYNVLSVIDPRHAGSDSGAVLDGRSNGIPVLATVDDAVESAAESVRPATHFVVGLAPDGGRLPLNSRLDVIRAIELGLNVDSGLHDYLSEDPEISEIAARRGVVIRDVRKPPPRNDLHFFEGKIEEVTCKKIAALGTDSAVGKRTSAVLAVQGFRDAGVSAELIGTGQTAWMQGFRYGIILDSLINDFVSGEIEHVVWSAWKDLAPDVLVVEGQGSLMNPAYPGGFEILAAARPDAVILQHAPARRDYDGFPGYRIHPLSDQIRAVELVSGRPVVAVTVNHENLDEAEARAACEAIRRETGMPAFDVLFDGPEGLVGVLRERLGL